jgi:hypothetical protein
MRERGGRSRKVGGWGQEAAGPVTLALAVALGLGGGAVACHGGSPAGSVQAADTQLSGVAFLAAPLAGRHVEVGDEQAPSGGIVGTSDADARGQWSCHLGPVSGTLRAEVVLSEEPASHRESAIIDALELGESRAHVEITPVTHLSAVYAHFLERQGEEPATALQSARSLFDAHFGGVDHARTDPIDPAAATSGPLSDGMLVGILLAGLGEEAATDAAAGSPEGDIGMAALISLLAEDIEDGIFDGRGASGPLEFAGVPLSPNSLRGDYATAIERFLSSSRNRSGFTAADLAPVLAAIRSDQSALFPPGTPPTRSAPIIHVGLLGPDLAPLPTARPARSDMYLEVHTDWSIPLQAIEATSTAAGSALGSDLFPPGDDARFLVKTTSLPDGPNTISIRVRDARGSETSTSIRVVVDNTPPVLTLVVPEESFTATIAVSGTWADAGGPVNVVLDVDGARVQLHDAPETFSTILAIPCGRDVVIEADATDLAGNAAVPVRVPARCSSDRLAISFGLSTAILEGDLLVDRSGEHLVYSVPPNARSSTISEATSRGRLRFEKYFTRLDASSDNALVVQLVVTGSVSDLGYRYLIDSVEHRGWTALSPLAEVTFPISYDTLGLDLVLGRQGATHRLEFRARDPSGREEVRALEFGLDILSPPLWLDACAPDTSVAFGELGARFVGGEDVPIARAELRYLLDVPSTSLAPRQGVSVNMTPGTSLFDIVELSEQKFAAPDYAPWDFMQGAPPNIQCNSWGEVSFQAFALWSEQEVCGNDETYPDDHVFYEAATDGAINEPSTSPSRGEIRDGLITLATAAGAPTIAGLPADRMLTLSLGAMRPVLLVNGRAYDWTTTYDAVPSGYVSLVNTAGRYRIGNPYLHMGSDVSFSGGLPPEVMVRPFVTRAAIHRFRLSEAAPVFFAQHARIAGLVAPVRTATVCQQPVVLEVQE